VLMKAILLRRTKDNEMLGVLPKILRLYMLNLMKKNVKSLCPSDLANTFRLTLE
ncbi:hypothetical protein S245_071764, partial [Arachis hypogaea]